MVTFRIRRKNVSGQNAVNTWSKTAFIKGSTNAV